MVQQVEIVPAQLEVDALCQVELAPERDISLMKWKAAQRIAAQAALPGGRRRTERPLTAGTACIDRIVESPPAGSPCVIQVGRHIQKQIRALADTLTVKV